MWLQSADLADYTPFWYHLVLEDFNNMNDYFDAKNMEKEGRKMAIWRTPIARLETANILAFKVADIFLLLLY